MRLNRTLFVNRWHAAVTLGEQCKQPAIGERAEHINHAASLSEYLWRFGAFCENPDGTGRIESSGDSTPVSGLRDLFRQLGTDDARVVRAAVHHTINQYGRPGTNAAPGLAEQVAQELTSLAQYGDEIERFARQFRQLQLAMLRFYRQMQYITESEEVQLRNKKLPITAAIFSTDANPGGKVSVGMDSFPVQGDPILAVQAAFGRNIYNALCWRARHELTKSGALSPWNEGMDFCTSAIVDGRRVRYTTDDKALQAMLLSLSEPPFPLWVQWCCSIKRAVSTMITALPMFIVRNFLRDTLAAFVLGRHLQMPVLSTMHGAATAIDDLRTGRNATLQDYLLQGGFNSGLAEAEIAAGPADEIIPSSSEYGSLLRKARGLLYVLTRPAWVTEVGTRLIQYRKALAAGATPYQAIRDARMVSTDFANIGAHRTWRMYIGTVPFFNAAIQGFDQLYQVWRPQYGRDASTSLFARDQSKQPPTSFYDDMSSGAQAGLLTDAQWRHLQKVRNAGLVLSAATAAIWYWNITGPERQVQYAGETEYEKSAYVTLYDVWGDRDLRVPVPFQIGAVFMKLPEIGLDLVASVDSLAGPGFFGHLVHGNLSIGWLPAVIKPIWEVQTNTNFFGEEIVPAYMRFWQPASRRYYRSTLAPYRRIGEVLNVSPLQVETIVRGYTGHLGNLLMVGLDELAWDAEANGPKPFPRFVSYASGLGVLINPGAESTSWWLNHFYDSQEHYPRCARNGSCRNFSQNANRLQRPVSNFFSNSRDRIERIATATNLSRTDKEARINTIYQAMHDRAREYIPVWQRLLARYE